jgi:hypothetical protein
LFVSSFLDTDISCDTHDTSNMHLFTVCFNSDHFLIFFLMLKLNICMCLERVHLHYLIKLFLLKFDGKYNYEINIRMKKKIPTFLKFWVESGETHIFNCILITRTV